MNIADEIESFQDEQKKPKTPKSFWKNLAWVEIFAISSMFIYLIYLQNTTDLVLNFNDGNETRVINGIANPPKTVLYPPNSFVPKSGVSNSQMIFGMILYSVVIAVLLANRMKQPTRATPKEAMDDLSKQLKQLRDLPLADGTTIPITDNLRIEIHPVFLTRYYETSENDRKEFRYTFQVIVKDRQEEVEYYYRAWYHPWTRYWDGLFPAKTLLSGKDACPNCGDEYNFKKISSKLIGELRELRRGFSGGGMGRM